MSERVIVFQDRSFQTSFKAADPNDEESDQVEPVHHLHDLTPYGMLLASVAACTAIVVNSYANHHDVPLKSVTIDTSYDRVFAEDCDDCDESNEYDEIIQEHMDFEGDLSSDQLERLHQVAKACSIRRMLQSGIRVETE
jgi:putative redox protein